MLESVPDAPGAPSTLPAPLSSDLTHCFLPCIGPAFSALENGRYKEPEVKNWNPHSGQTTEVDTHSPRGNIFSQ